MKFTWINNGEPNENGEIIAEVLDDNGKMRSRFIGKSDKEVTEKILLSYANATEEIGRLKQNRVPDRGRPTTIVQPRTLTPDERFRISADLTDPERGPEAINEIVTAAVGAPPAVVGKFISKAEKEEADRYCREEAFAFRKEHPEYYNCDENMHALFDELERRDISFSRNNLAIVYDDLNAQGRLIAKPDDDEPTEDTQPVSQQRPNTAAEPNPPRPTTRPRTIATGIRNSDASALKPPPPRPKYSRAEIATMTRDEYAAKMRDPAFRQLVDSMAG
jgi:hypothetical protein